MGLISRVSSRTYRNVLFNQPKLNNMAEFARALQTQNIWYAAQEYRDAEIKLVQHRLGLSSGDAPAAAAPVKEQSKPKQAAAPKAAAKESKASQMIKELKKEPTTDSNAAINDMSSMLERVSKLERENNEIKESLKKALARLDQLEGGAAKADSDEEEFDPFDMVTVEDSITKRQIDPKKVQAEQDAKKAAAAADDDSEDEFDPFDIVTVEDSITKRQVDPKKMQAEQDAKKAAKENEDSDAEDDDDDDDMDFFGSDDEEEDAAAEALKQKRVADYNARKAEKAEKKGVVAAKSMITLDVKPWDDETDLDELAVKVKTITQDGLVWGQQIQKKPLAFGIFKLVVTAIVEDEKVSTDDLVESIEAFEDHVQSVDIAAFNKL